MWRCVTWRNKGELDRCQTKVQFRSRSSSFRSDGSEMRFLCARFLITPHANRALQAEEGGGGWERRHLIISVNQMTSPDCTIRFLLWRSLTLRPQVFPSPSAVLPSSSPSVTKPNDAVSSSLLASVDIAYLDTRNLGADFDVLLLLGFRFVPRPVR